MQFVYLGNITQCPLSHPFLVNSTGECTNSCAHRKEDHSDMYSYYYWCVNACPAGSSEISDLTCINEKKYRCSDKEYFIADNQNVTLLMNTTELVIPYITDNAKYVFISSSTKGGQIYDTDNNFPIENGYRFYSNLMSYKPIRFGFIETFLFHLELNNEIVSNTCTMKVKVSDEGCEAVDYSSNDFCIHCRAGYYRKNSSTKCELQPKGSTATHVVDDV